MKSKTWMLPAIATLILVAGSLTLGVTSKTAVKKEKNPTCCQKMKECRPVKTGEVIIDNISAQFISILPLN